MHKLRLCIVPFLFIMSVTQIAIGKQININEKLDSHLESYKRVNVQTEEEAISTLVNIDSEIRALLKVICDYTAYDIPHDKYWKADYSELDLYVDRFSECFSYSGGLLEKAHSINPNSQYKSYTYFSKINSNKYCWIEEPKNIEAAHQYLKEYPDGPFVIDVYYNVGHFYWSLYNNITYIMAEVDNDSGNYLSYIKDPSSITLEKQAQQAKEETIKYFNLYLDNVKDGHNSENIKNLLRDVHEGTDTIYGDFSCPD